MSNRNRVLFTLFVAAYCLSMPWKAFSAEAKTAAILVPTNSSSAELLAAREVRRYVYVRTDRLLPILFTPQISSQRTLIVIGRKERVLPLPGLEKAPQLLGPGAYFLRTLNSKETANLGSPYRNREMALLIGGDDAGILYAAYHFAEALGVRFYLHDDVVPDEKVPFKLPALNECAKPLFAIRGIQPFHDFPEGPDWWNREEYLAIIGQLPKLRMNFIGLHTYPEGRPNAEPTVWIGPESEIGVRGAVKSSYPSSYQNTLRGNWGYAPKKTHDYAFGAALLFDRDDYGPEVMEGQLPAPTTAAGCNQVFNRTADMLREAFTFAHEVGVKTCVGTETPLVVPQEVRDRLQRAGRNISDRRVIQELYAGIFRRASEAYPLDYYWFWTPEGWTWSGTKDEDVRATTDDLFAAIAAHQEVKPPFALATCGWVLGPQQDRALFDKVLPKEIAVSCINREVGKTPVEPGFATVQGRSKWAIPWMEDDPALAALQLWAGRMRRDAADALRYGCDGLLGIHWRTRILAPNVAALAQAAWDQRPWIGPYNRSLPEKAARKPGPVGGQVAAFPNNRISGTDDPVLYQTVRYNVSAYHLPASNGLCRVTLKFCEPHYAESGKRVFGVRLQGVPVISGLDIFARVGKDKALDLTFDTVSVTNGWVDIDFVPEIEFPSVAAIDVQGNGFSSRINCGGPAYRDYAADEKSAEPVRQVYAATDDFYRDWATHEFGPAAGVVAGQIFTKIDCKLPVPSVWTDGPGGIQPDARAWQDVKGEYAFVDEFASLRPLVKGAGARSRFEYWLQTLEYFRSIAQVNCVWAEFNRAMERVRTGSDAAKRKALAQELAVPARRELARVTGELYDRLLATVTTTGELGTVANWEQHNFPVLLGKPGEELAAFLGAPLSADLQLRKNYLGPTRIVVPAKRTSLGAGEPFELKVIVLSEAPPRAATIHYRKLGTGSFTAAALRHVARGVYRVQLDWSEAADLEYYVKVQPKSGKAVFFPSAAPRLSQTVIIRGSR